MNKYGKESKKRKLEEYEVQVEQEEAEQSMQGDEVAEPAVQRSGKAKKPKLDTTGVGKVSNEQLLLWAALGDQREHKGRECGCY